MCGLVGIAGDTMGKPKDMFTELLVIDSLRGMHSTGMALVKRFQNEVKLVKRPGPSQFLIVDPDYKSAMSAPAKVIIGHNRYATVGQHTIANAHPFAFEHVVGAHNGTLDHFAVRRLHHNEKFDTDSEAIFAHINEYSIEETVKHLSGAWALTWFDNRDNTLNMLRNDKRPLFYTYCDDRKVLMWASEVEMLEFTLARNNWKKDGQEFFGLEKNIHFKWKVPNEATGRFETPIQKELKPDPIVNRGFNGYHGRYGGAYGNWTDEDRELWSHEKPEDKTNVTPPFRSASAGHDHNQQPNVVSLHPKENRSSRSRVDTKRFRPPYKCPDGKAVPKTEFFKIISNGCLFCSDNSPTWGEFVKILKDTTSTGTKLFICEDCYNTDDISDICEYGI